MTDSELERLWFWAAHLWSLMTEEEKRAAEKEHTISWVYGNTRISNPAVTREMVERAVERRDNDIQHTDGH